MYIVTLHKRSTWECYQLCTRAYSTEARFTLGLSTVNWSHNLLWIFKIYLQFFLGGREKEEVGGGPGGGRGSGWERSSSYSWLYPCKISSTIAQQESSPWWTTHCMKSEFLCSLQQRKKKFYASLWWRKESFMPLWSTVNGAFMFLYRKVTIKCFCY